MFFYNESDSEVSQVVPTPSDPYFYNTSLLLKMDSDFSDSSIYNHSVTVNGMTSPTSTESKYGGASGDFTSTGKYLRIEDHDSLSLSSADSWTMECWIYPLTGPTGYRSIISKRTPGDSNNEFEIYLDYTTGNLGWVVSGVQYDSSYKPTFEAWNHIAYQSNGSTTKYFLNGVLVHTTTARPFEGPAPLFIGSSYNGGTSFVGYIDDVRITKGVARYTDSFTPPDSHPTTGPGIVTDSLTLNLDIGDDTSYAGTGTTVNNIAGSDTATLTGNILFSPDNEGYLDFDGADDTMGVANGSSVDITDTITVEAWVNPDAVAGWLTLISKNNVQQPEGYHFGFDPSGNMMGGVRNSGNWITTQTGTPVNIGQWQHLVMSMDTNTNIQKFYKNGALVYTNSNFTANLNSNTNPLSVSGQPITGVEKYNGKLAKAALYSRALTDAEVEQNFNALKSRFGL